MFFGVPVPLWALIPLGVGARSRTGKAGLTATTLVLGMAALCFLALWFTVVLCWVTAKAMVKGGSWLARHLKQARAERVSAP